MTSRDGRQGQKPQETGTRKRQRRAEATRERLLEATFDCLVELGYARTSTPEVLRRTGISRGALLHHFPTRIDLVTAAIDYVFARQIREYLEAFQGLPAGQDKASASIELLWGRISGPTYYAWLELVVAARTDPVLLSKIREIDDRFHELVRETHRAMFPSSREAPTYHHLAPRFALATLNGLAVAAIHQDPADQQPVLEGLAELARVVGRFRGSSDLGETGGEG